MSETVGINKLETIVFTFDNSLRGCLVTKLGPHLSHNLLDELLVVFVLEAVTQMLKTIIMQSSIDKAYISYTTVGCVIKAFLLVFIFLLFTNAV